MPPYLLALGIVVSIVALAYARWEYRRRNRLTLVGLTLLCAMLLMPNLAMHYAIRYEMPSSLLEYAGVAISLAGLISCVVTVVFFRSVLKMLCLDTGELTTGGPYRWGRNPQYVFYFVFLFGFALIDWSWWSLGSLVLVAASLHVLVLIEEKHLARVFGEPYLAYRRRVPRYARLFGRSTERSG